jgi:predicted ATP-grasp superfamily ATP-dependent carboligase
MTFAVYASDDPLPWLVELPIVIFRVLKRRFPGRISFFTRLARPLFPPTLDAK